MKDIRLGVNVDHIATLREARKTTYPDPVEAALVALRNGADGITVHLREDRRHIRERDVLILRQTVHYLNLEMSVAPDIVEFACKVKPNCSTIVPEKRKELTTEGGLDVINNFDTVRDVVSQLRKSGIFVSLFIEADTNQIDASNEAGADAIEIHTGHYADASSEEEKQEQYEKILKACEYASKIGLVVNAGHGLNYFNVKPIAAIEYVNELNIGHSIIAAASIEGMASAVRRMKQLMLEARI